MDLEVTIRDQPATRWWKVKDLDTFMGDLYRFYDSKGLGNAVTKGILDLARVLFIVFVFVVITVVFDWEQLAHRLEHSNNCTTEAGQKIDLFTQCNGNVPIDFYRLLRMSWVSVGALVLFLFIWAGYLVWFLGSIPRLRTIRKFYTEELDISHRQLQTIKWTKVVDRIILAQRRLQLCTLVEDFDPLTITNLITRKHNFLIALYSEIGDDLAVNLPLLGRRVILSQSLQYNIEKILWAIVFNGGQDSVTADLFSEHSTSVQNKMTKSLTNHFKLYGVINFVLALPICIVRLAYFLFHNSDSLRKSSGTLATRQWSPYACWRMRNYSETEHVFRARLSRSCKPATRYVDLFVSEMGTIWGRFLVFVFGGLFVMLTLLGFIFDEDFLFAYLTPERSVIWWTGIIGALLAVSNSLVPAEVSHASPAVLLSEVKKHTHFFREAWVDEEGSLDTFDDFSELFQLKGITFVEELISILFFTPYLLFFRLPKLSSKIVTFFRTRSYKHPQLPGHFCEFASLKFNDKAEDVEASRHGESLIDGADASMFSKVDSESFIDKTKLDASVANFMLEHPDWQPSTSTRSQTSRDTSSSFPPPSSLHQHQHQQQQHQQHSSSIYSNHDDEDGDDNDMQRELSPATSLVTPLLRR
eukprot:m.155937 g.155937  ORF g.155937 m.155937 type:complete len:641 (+) comp30961_c6_seq1:311-2233(+)